MTYFLIQVSDSLQPLSCLTTERRARLVLVALKQFFLRLLTLFSYLWLVSAKTLFHRKVRHFLSLESSTVHTSIATLLAHLRLDLTTRTCGVDPRLVHVGLLVDKMAQGHDFIQILQFSPVSIIPSKLHRSYSTDAIYEGRTESHEQLFFFACELGTADEGECGGRWNQLLCYP